MVLHAAADDGLAFEIGQGAAKIFVQFIAQRFVAKEWPPVFGGKDRVHENFGERLRHGGNNESNVAQIQSHDIPKRDGQVFHQPQRG